MCLSRRGCGLGKDPARAALVLKFKNQPLLFLRTARPPGVWSRPIMMIVTVYVTSVVKPKPPEMTSQGALNGLEACVSL
jgi:hypothetical protein